MDTQQIIDALKDERMKLDRALAVLEGSSRVSVVRSRRASVGAPRWRRHMSAEARARIAAAQRRRWAKIKAKWTGCYLGT